MHFVRSLRGLAILCLASLGFCTSVHAQTLPVDVDITVDANGTAILNYYSEIDVVISPGDLAALHGSSYCPPAASGLSECTHGPGSAGTATLGSGAGGGDLRGDGALTLTAPSNNLRGVRLDLDNVWAIRATGGPNVYTTVSVLVGVNATLNHESDGASTIVITDAQVYAMSGGLTDDSVNVPDPGLLIPVFGGVQLTLDMGNAVSAGVYSTTGVAAAENYLIGVTGT